MGHASETAEDIAPKVDSFAGKLAAAKSFAGNEPAEATTLKVRGLSQRPDAVETGTTKRVATKQSADTTENHGKVQLASAEEDVPFNWGDLSLAKPKPSKPVNNAPAATAEGNGWKSLDAEPAASEAGGAAGWKKAR
jgi:hypothetical protein